MMGEHPEMDLADGQAFHIDGETRIAGVMGWPVHHTLSPAMHNAAYLALGLNWRYVAFQVAPDHVWAAVAGMRALRLAGLNVTIPHKEAVIPYLDDVMPAARAIGAVNTILVAEDRLIGDNTDTYGFLRALEEAGIQLAGRKALVLGAGGAARAATYGLASRGARVVILSRTLARARQLALDMLRSTPTADIEAVEMAPEDASLLINCTPVGMWPHDDASPLPAGFALHPGLAVMDMVYRPQQTALMHQARDAGTKIVSGLEMLVHQAAAAFERWTGVKPPVDTMRAACLGALERRC
jgi:shikimate dehydrogenase